jgi:predicted metal-dependent phosphoesterase TrpH
VVGLPHPFDGFRSSGGAKADDGAVLDAIAHAVDYIEVHNARAVGRANERAALFANERGLPGVASSDAHVVMEVGVSYTVLPGAFTSADELRALLPEADLVTGRASYYVRAWTPFAKLVQRVRGNGRVSLPADPDAAGTEP